MRGQISVQNEGRLKLHRACNEPLGQAPVTLEPNRRPNMKGGYSRRADLSAYTERQEEVIREKSLLEKTLDAHELNTRHFDTSMLPQSPPLTATQENTLKMIDQPVQNVSLGSRRRMQLC